MSSFWWKFVFGIGFLSLIHSAYSAAQHRTYLRITEEEFTSLPLDIIFQSLLSLVMTMCGILHIAGDFKEIRASMELKSKTWDLLGNRPSFYTFSHRGRIFDPLGESESS
ncbi:hypothetical protein CHUAL_002781 [Chamberlinius hualienensis]